MLSTGKGYVPAELNKPEEPPLGLDSYRFFIQPC